MLRSSQPIPLENIIHKTGIRPFSIHYTEVPQDDNSALYLHCHPEAELFYLTRGKICFHVENQDFFLNAGEGIFIPPDLLHSAECIPSHSATPDNCSFYALVFSTDLLEKSLPPYCQNYFKSLHQQKMDCIFPIFNTYETETLRKYLPELFKYYQKELADCELSILGRLLSIWQEIYNLHFRVLSRKDLYSSTRAELQSSIDYMQRNYTENLTLAGLAAEVGLSEGHYCRSFKAYTGVTPFTYLNKIRIIKSCELLQDTNKKITDIAALCGFGNISYFNRMFLKWMGVTPSDYRKNF